jgi:predicted RNA polymerase sigma factor
VLEVIYLIFNEGYAAAAGEDWLRPALCEDALRLGRVLGELMPIDPEVHGLVALMELQSSRQQTRVDGAGTIVRLADQNRALWDRLLIGRGLAALDRARELGGLDGPYALQAAIAACHARATSMAETDWVAIADLYGRLGTCMPSPVVELNRAVAVGMAYGPQAGLDLIEALGAHPALRDYPPLPSVRADLLERLGRFADAQAGFERAASLTQNARERALLLARAEACRNGGRVSRATGIEA